MAMAQKGVSDQIPSDPATADKPVTIDRHAEWLVLSLCTTSFVAYLYLSKAAVTYVHLYLTMVEKLCALLGS
jgi:hypothetical protein